MRPPHRTLLTLLRLSLVFITLCLVLSQLEIAKRRLDDQTIGLPSPFFVGEPLLPRSTLPFMGVTLDPELLSEELLATTLDEISAAGFGWVRVRLAWDQIQTSPATYEWERIDSTLATLQQANLTPIFLLDGSPAWARAPSDRLNADGRFAPPANPASFARFTRRVAERYGERVRYYQIWDEPNIAPHWGSRFVEPVNYARLLKAVSTAIRDLDADAYILTASLAPTADRGHLALDEGFFLKRLYAAGAAPYFDGVAIQPFGFASTPHDLDVDRSALNFRRTLLMRQTMLDAGDGSTPLWLLSFGWNRAPASNWRSVSEEQQVTYSVEALKMAYRQWPWVVAMGWPLARALPHDHAAGFALTPELAESFRTTSLELSTQRRAQRTAAPPLALWRPVALWWLAVIALLWRGVAAARQLPWARLGVTWITRPAWVQAIFWTLLLLVYHLAVWPPLLMLCALLAALGFLAQPHVGLALALLFLPFHDYHKEFDWLGRHWLVPPTQAILLCLLPAMWRTLPRSLPPTFGRDRWLGVALGWLAIMLLSATGVWNWQAYWLGMLNLVITPLCLFVLLRAWATTPQLAYTFVAALAAGGVLIAEIGLFDWIQGNGTVVDDMRRLTGLGFSSNHTALYLIRTLAIALGLMLIAHNKLRWFWAFCAFVMGVALFLTGSRGAILLGIPAGALYIFSRQNLPLPDRRRLIGLSLVVGTGLVVMAWMWQDRLANIGTMIARMDGWIVALSLWREHFLFGVGPDGFWWTFPAQMWLSSDADPNLRHPHNIWLELATSGGVLALIWLGATAVLLYRWVRERGSTLSWVQIGLLTGLIAAFAHAQVDSFQSLSELAGWNWAALALLLVWDKQPQETAANHATQ